MQSDPKLPVIIECFDIGGTNIRGVLIEDGKIKGSVYVEASIRNNPDALIKQIKYISNTIRAKETDLDVENIKVVSIGVPGPVEGDIMFGSKPLEIEERVSFPYRLKDYFQIPVLLENDMNMAVNAELAMGVGKQTKNFCLVTISTGIGVGLVVNGQIYNRKTEIGHSVIEKDFEVANPCQGHSGCWGAQASGDGIKKTLEKLGSKINVAQIFDDPAYVSLVQLVKEYNAHGFGILVNAYDPEKIVIMGSVGTKQFDLIIPDKKDIARYTLVQTIPDVELTLIGGDIGLYGAYYRALNWIKNS
jgi:glucokinase